MSLNKIDIILNKIDINKSKLIKSETFEKRRLLLSR